MNEKTTECPANIMPMRTYLFEGDAALAAHDYPVEEGRALQDYLHIFLAYRWLVFSVSILVLACTLLYSFLATPLYTSEAKLKIQSYFPLLPNTNIEDVLRQQTRETEYLLTQTELLSSLTLADKVLSEPGMESELKTYFSRKTGFFSVIDPFLKLISGAPEKSAKHGNDAGGYHFPLPMLQRYLRMLSILPIRKTSLVKVSATTAVPELSAKIANLHSEAFINLVRNERQQNALENLVFLKKQAEELSEKVALSEREIASYAEQNAIISVNKDQNIVVQRMAELSQLLTSATVRRIQSESTYNEAKSGSGLSSTAVDDQSIQDIRTRLKDLQSEYAMLGMKFTPSYPRMIQMKARIADLTRNLAEQRAQAVTALKAKFQADVEAEEELKKQLEIQKSRAFELSRREVQYNIMRREYDSLKDLHQSVLRQLKESQVSAESRGTNVTLSDRAALPLSHSSPKRMLNALAALVIGPAIGFGLALLLDALDNTLKTPDQVQDLLQIPALGVVPAFSSDSRLVQDERDLAPPQAESGNSAENSAALPVPHMAGDLITLKSPHSISSEAFRTIRTGILLSSADSPPRVILVTSAKKGEGKTTLINNLAVTLAQSSSKTIIVDADLRRPNVGRCFGMDAEVPGLVDYLTGQKPLEHVISSPSLENLSIIPAGSKPPNPAELVGSRKMAELLQLLSSEFDYVLIDSPPVLPVADAIALSRIVDGVVLVIRGQDTQKQAAKDTSLRLRQVGAKLLGVVLNDVDVHSGHYYYYYRSAYADYYAEEKSSRRRKSAHG